MLVVKGTEFTVTDFNNKFCRSLIKFLDPNNKDKVTIGSVDFKGPHELIITSYDNKEKELNTSYKKLSEDNPFIVTEYFPTELGLVNSASLFALPKSIKDMGFGTGVVLSYSKRQYHQGLNGNRVSFKTISGSCNNREYDFLDLYTNSYPSVEEALWKMVEIGIDNIALSKNFCITREGEIKYIYSNYKGITLGRVNNQGQILDMNITNKCFDEIHQTFLEEVKHYA